MSQYQEKTTVLRVEQFSHENYRITFRAPDIARVARAGQFVMIKAGLGKDPLLRRPFSIHQTSSSGQLQIYFKIVGRGTDMLARVKVGEEVSMFGPLGRGFQVKKTGSAILIGGGLGIAPMLFLAKSICRLKRERNGDLIILGGRSRVEVEPLVKDFREFGLRLLTATDDGSFGHEGFVTDLLDAEELSGKSMVYTCGPEPMMARIGKLCRDHSIPCQVSVESVMACGMGACLGCSRKTRKGTYAHVCLNGPVFDAEELIWNS
ncbi:dihydroorotate dehydrogenase electron transfer subunit [Desulfomarina sp.]